MSPQLNRKWTNRAVGSWMPSITAPIKRNAKDISQKERGGSTNICVVSNATVRSLGYQVSGLCQEPFSHYVGNAKSRGATGHIKFYCT